MSFSEKEPIDKFVDVIADVMHHVVSEPRLLILLEPYFEPKPALLAISSGEEAALQKRVNCLIEKMGGPPQGPQLIVKIKNVDYSKPFYNTYGKSAMQEIIGVFHRARLSVTRAHMIMIVFSVLRDHPDWLLDQDDKEGHDYHLKASEKAYWEHAEYCYIRLASFWDRVGQLFDYIFFSIRQFEHDGFSSVMDRIRINRIPIDPVLECLPGWIHLRNFQTSEQEDGLKWLLRRRNLLIHSLYLRPMENTNDETLFYSEFDHLDNALQKKLLPGTIHQELERIHLHLARAANLFSSVMDICEHATNGQPSK